MYLFCSIALLILSKISFRTSMLISYDPMLTVELAMLSRLLLWENEPVVQVFLLTSQCRLLCGPIKLGPLSGVSPQLIVKILHLASCSIINMSDKWLTNRRLSRHYRHTELAWHSKWTVQKKFWYRPGILAFPQENQCWTDKWGKTLLTQS